VHEAWPASRRKLAPIVDYAAGGFGDVRGGSKVETGRRYSMVEFKATIIWHFGNP
jgi:hypothetical protein